MSNREYLYRGDSSDLHAAISALNAMSVAADEASEKIQALAEASVDTAEILIQKMEDHRKWLDDMSRPDDGTMHPIPKVHRNSTLEEDYAAYYKAR